MDSQLDDNRVWVRLAIVALVRFFDEAPGTTKAHLTLDEVGRIGITTLVAAGGLFGILEIVRWTSGSTFPAPVDAAMACAVLTLMLETRRRLNHGRDDHHRPARPRRRS